MTAARSLVELLDRSVRHHAERTAVTVPGGEQLTYAQLDSLSGRVRDRLYALGVLPGDRVGFKLHKSAGTLAIIFGILKAHAAYVPVDIESPPARAAYILNNCRVRVVVTERSLRQELIDHLQQLGSCPVVLEVEDGATAESLDKLLISPQPGSISAPATTPGVADGDGSLAYILYTSGSTGRPKGVMLSHDNALSFIDWCTTIFQPTAVDRIASHAPFHFDLSIFDIYISVKHGATLVLIGEALGKEAMRLAQAISVEQISIWYSTPSILSLLARYGKMQRYDYSCLRLVLFAGEVFPVSQFLGLRSLWSTPRFFNLYGPTETNVCTWYEIPSGDSVAHMAAFPIGGICPPNKAQVIDERGERIPNGGAGELVISGPNVMQGYWELPEMNSQAFWFDRDGVRWYRTGDIVIEDPNAVFKYVGRRDRMVKRRGYRVELGEIEAGLLRNEDIREAAVVATQDLDCGVRITAFVSGGQQQPLSLRALKSLCIRSLLPYMMPDDFVVLETVPRTSTNKVDYQELKRRAG